jgi:hypothetical protein
MDSLVCLQRGVQCITFLFVLQAASACHVSRIVV